MQTLRHRSKGQAVYLLEEILVKLGYKVKISQFFGRDTHFAVRDFQAKNNLIVDGLVGPKTWSLLIAKSNEVINHNDKFLSEQDLINFANQYNLELAAVKAVNAIESSGKGFLLNGKPKILFEGHIFWRQLDKRGINPQNLVNPNTQNILYPKWTRKYYLRGNGEYNRLDQAIQIDKAAALNSASWGAFQIMGYHAQSLGYNSVEQFVSKMYEHEREHLTAFGKFLEVNRFSGKNLIEWLQLKHWRNFARAYNGPAYAKNKYDLKLQRAYERYSN